MDIIITAMCVEKNKPAWKMAVKKKNHLKYTYVCVQGKMLTETDIGIHRCKANWSGVGNYVIATLKLQGLTHKQINPSSYFNWAC